MRRVVVLAVLAVLAASGCGGTDEQERAAPPAQEPTPVPTATPVPTPEAAAEVRRRLAGGEIGVVDFERRALVAPPALRVNKEQKLSGVEWEGWGDPTATGRGEVETLVCDPSCAGGRVERSRATLTLSEPRVCGGERYYSAGKLVDRKGEAGVFLLTPC